MWLPRGRIHLTILCWCAQRTLAQWLAPPKRQPPVLVIYKFIDIQSLNLYIVGMKPLEFAGSSQEDLRNFPAEARRAVGFEMNFVQQGLMPSDWKPMKEVGPGTMELRIHVLGEWRVIYVAKFADAVHVLHAFQKKTQKTRQEDIELARKRYREIGGK